VYEWINQVPLNGKPDSIIVNFFSYRILTPDEKTGEKKVAFKYSWVTDFEVASKNVEALVRAGRCRWKIESAPQAHGMEVQHELTNCAKAA
jgi:hypothetical protein